MHFYRAMHFSAKRVIILLLRLHVVRPSVTLVDQDHTVWKQWLALHRAHYYLDG